PQPQPQLRQGAPIGGQPAEPAGQAGALAPDRADGAGGAGGSDAFANDGFMPIENENDLPF
ncbi:MAG: hypothetical protein LBJ10_02760, partial [Clostridiales bacterium]|nr:hypothetical protein [Clostridiales bacterium]